ncbi:hypothetical protein SE15_08185 [Thermanaerothrix daxensis]|uniref:Uncharacterized protein n=1 Tax=Thermanaerothrix daxensis TaxID=869279 RepID=A0A0P6Y2E0_9CHLR|nr:hypothetical protein [Thermanaerothrix daxensis]KPL83215.1 hypothetical protein SE15_08185 [Thermanaerothrix daxensis]
MYNEDTELLFPLRVLPYLRDLRGPLWQNLVSRLEAADVSLVDQVAFTLLMVRLNNCLTCNADSFRGMRGCTQCARTTIRRYRGQDKELMEQFEHCRAEVKAFLLEQAKSV